MPGNADGAGLLGSAGTRPASLPSGREPRFPAGSQAREAVHVKGLTLGQLS